MKTVYYTRLLIWTPIITPVFNILSEEISLQLERGDLLVMLMDGLTEGRSPSSTKMFGEEE
ncbi:MAG: hypothetical protein O9301_11250 [Leptospira sp.]|nr:hypothetical protein [Leptospira sp.]